MISVLLSFWLGVFANGAKKASSCEFVWQSYLKCFDLKSMAATESCARPLLSNKLNSLEKAKLMEFGTLKISIKEKLLECQNSVSGSKKNEAETYSCKAVVIVNHQGKEIGSVDLGFDLENKKCFISSIRYQML